MSGKDAVYGLLTHLHVATWNLEECGPGKLRLGQDNFITVPLLPRNMLFSEFLFHNRLSLRTNTMWWSCKNLALPRPKWKNSETVLTSALSDFVRVLSNKTNKEWKQRFFQFFYWPFFVSFLYSEAGCIGQGFGGKELSVVLYRSDLLTECCVDGTEFTGARDVGIHVFQPSERYLFAHHCDQVHEFIVINCHLLRGTKTKAKEARKAQILGIAQNPLFQPYPVLLVGDFNCDSSEIAQYLATFKPIFPTVPTTIGGKIFDGFFLFNSERSALEIVPADGAEVFSDPEKSTAMYHKGWLPRSFSNDDGSFISNHFPVGTHIHVNCKKNS